MASREACQRHSTAGSPAETARMGSIPLIATQACGECRTTWYCGRECQRADYKRHRNANCMHTMPLLHRAAASFGDPLRSLCVQREMLAIRRLFGPLGVLSIRCDSDDGLLALARDEGSASGSVLASYFTLADIERLEKASLGEESLLRAARVAATTDPTRELTVLLTSPTRCLLADSASALFEPGRQHPAAQLDHPEPSAAVLTQVDEPRVTGAANEKTRSPAQHETCPDSDDRSTIPETVSVAAAAASSAHTTSNACASTPSQYGLADFVVFIIPIDSDKAAEQTESVLRVCLPPGSRCCGGSRLGS